MLFLAALDMTVCTSDSLEQSLKESRTDRCPDRRDCVT